MTTTRFCDIEGADHVRVRLGDGHVTITNEYGRDTHLSYLSAASLADIINEHIVRTETVTYKLKDI